MSQALDDYTRAFRALEQFRFDHLGVLVQLEGLRDDLQEAEDQLKDFARQNGPEENDDILVAVQQKVKRWYDSDTLLKKARWLAEQPHLIAFDTKGIERLIKAGLIPADLVAESIRTEDMTPAVSVRVKVPEVKKMEVA